MSVAAAAAVLMAAGGASAEEIKQEPSVPRVIEWLTVEAGGAPLTMSLWVGGHTWLAQKYLVGFRFGTRQTILERDLNGDGTIDFAKSIGNNPLQFEVDADFAIPIKRRFGHEIYGSGARQITRDARGRTVQRWTERVLVPNVRETSIATGVRMAILGDETQVALPIGLRLSKRALTRGKRFKEWWAQARVLIIPQRIEKVGVDLEATWMLRPFGVSLFLEYFPRIGTPDPNGPSCKFGPQRCDPATPLTAFNRIPDENQLMIGMRVRMTLPR